MLITIGPEGVSADDDKLAVPARVTVVGEFPAVLAIASIALSDPETVGVNVTPSCDAWPGFKVTGRATPLNANGLEAVIALMVMDCELLLFVSVTFCVLLAPTVTLPKFRAVGFAESCRLEATPVPLRPIAVGDVGALLTNDKEPVTLPEAEGVKATGIVPEPPAATVIGNARLPALKPVPVTFTALIDRLAPPAFNTVTDCFAVLPSVTFPNVKLPGVTETCG